MEEKLLHTVCCCKCGKVLSQSYEGTKTYIRCPKCKTDLFYQVFEDGPAIKIVKKGEKIPHIPLVPA